jgi:uncharacterized RDD family membrane protein YckC
MTTPDDPFQTPPEGTPPPPPPDPGAPQYGAPPPPYGAPPPYGGPQYGAPPPQWGGQAPQFPGSGGYQMPPPPQGPAGAPLAAWGWRVLGYLIDAVIVAIPAIILGVAAGSRGVYDIIAILGGLTIGYLNGAQGQSPGKRVVGIKVVRESDGQLIGGGMGIVRVIAHFLDTLACLIGWFWPLWDDKRQTFADKIIGTVVIKL